MVRVVWPSFFLPSFLHSFIHSTNASSLALLTQHDTQHNTGVYAQCRSAEFDGEEATAAAVEQAIGQGVFTGAFNSLRKALADKTNGA
jgi:hypothetical protein